MILIELKKVRKDFKHLRKAEALRLYIESKLDSQTPVEINCLTTGEIPEKFADELYGKLCVKYELELIKRLVTITHMRSKENVFQKVLDSRFAEKINTSSIAS